MHKNALFYPYRLVTKSVRIKYYIILYYFTQTIGSRSPIINLLSVTTTTVSVKRPFCFKLNIELLSLFTNDYRVRPSVEHYLIRVYQ